MAIIAYCILMLTAVYFDNENLDARAVLKEEPF